MSVFSLFFYWKSQIQTLSQKPLVPMISLTASHSPPSQVPQTTLLTPHLHQKVEYFSSATSALDVRGPLRGWRIRFTSSPHLLLMARQPRLGDHTLYTLWWTQPSDWKVSWYLHLGQIITNLYGTNQRGWSRNRSRISLSPLPLDLSWRKYFEFGWDRSLKKAQSQSSWNGLLRNLLQKSQAGPIHPMHPNIDSATHKTLYMEVE